MSTILYPSPIFGPVHSRRLGLSLGINLMPADGKLCTFDCLYCECGLNAPNRPTQPRPSRVEVAEALEKTLRQMATAGEHPDVLTFAGNGEPTAHPDFPAIIDDTLRLRDALCPSARVSVLSNATMLHRQAVVEALRRIDNNIQKLDTVDIQYISLVDRPAGAYDVEQVIRQLEAFEGNVIVQSLFMAGSVGGRSVDNTTNVFVSPWLEALRRIAPREVMVYTIDRETPISTLKKAPRETLDAIAQRVREAGLPVSVSY